MHKTIKLSLIAISVLLMSISCNNASTQKAAVVQNSDTVINTAASTVNTASVQDFIESHTKIRKEANASIDEYKISSEILISIADFSIINFIEIIQNYRYEYSIVLNPGVKIAIPKNGPTAYDEIASSLERQSIKYNLYVGNMQQSADFTNDGSPDFILTVETNFRTSMSSKSELLLFDGKSELKNTGAIASSDFTAGECEFLIGVEEKLIINEKSHEITTHRLENISPGGCNAEELIQLNYDKVWTFEKGKSEFTAKLNTPVLDTLQAFLNFPKKFTLIAKKGEKYVVPENCQTGGANTYEFSCNNTSEQTKIYIFKKSSEIEYYFLVGFKQPDQQTAIFYLKQINSTEQGYDINAMERAGELKTFKIVHDADNADRYWITYAKDSEPKLATTDPGKYEFEECGK
jgi:hypothetical protein